MLSYGSVLFGNIAVSYAISGLVDDVIFAQDRRRPGKRDALYIGRR